MHTLEETLPSGKSFSKKATENDRNDKTVFLSFLEPFRHLFLFLANENEEHDHVAMHAQNRGDDVGSTWLKNWRSIQVTPSCWNNQGKDSSSSDDVCGCSDDYRSTMSMRGVEEAGVGMRKLQNAKYQFFNLDWQA